MNEKKKLQPKVRFREFTGENAPDWEQRKLGEVVERVTRKNHNLISTLPLTISAQFGLVDQTTFFKKQVASKDVSGYYLLKNGEFAYNKSYSKDYPWGTIKRLDLYDMGVLSTLYILFKPVLINSNFLVAYYETDYWHKEIAIRSAEGARNHGLLNITARDFFDTRLIIPENNIEQKQIGHLFEKLDKLITLHQRKLEQLEQLKNTLLSKMFPKSGTNIPEIRFSGFTDAWKQRKLGEVVNITMGQSPNSENYTENPDDNILVQGNADLKNGRVFPRVWTTQITKTAEKGDLILSVRAPVGSVGKTDYDVVLGRGVAGIKGNEFIFQMLGKMNIDGYWNKYSTGSTFESINSNDIIDAQIVLPKEDEQIKLGIFLHQLDEIITIHQRKLEQLKNLKQTLLNKMFI